MSKRFSDTEIWDKEWFMNLKPSIKCLVKLVRDKADLCGIWSPNFTIVSMYLGEKITESDLLKIDDGNQFKKMPNGKIYCIGFIEFQYGELSEKSPVHRKVIKILEQNDFLEDYHKKSSNRLLNTLLYRVKEKEEEEEEEEEKDKEEEEENGENSKIPTVEFPDIVVEEKLDNEMPKPFTSVGKKNDYIEFDFLEFKNIKIKPDEFEKLCNEFTQDTSEKAISYLSDYKVEKAYKTKSDYLTIRRWVVDAVTKQKNAQNGNTKNNKGTDDLICGINASSLAGFLGTSTDELLGRTTNGTR